jgi:hypothetical protein
MRKDGPSDRLPEFHRDCIADEPTHYPTKDRLSFPDEFIGSRKALQYCALSE